MSNVRNYNPSEGQAYQGDVCIFLVPKKVAVKLNRIDEISPVAGRLILQEGEFSGHHHAIKLPQPVMFRDDAMAQELETNTRAAAATARMFRDPDMAQALVNEGILTRTNLTVGFLEIEGGEMTVTHEEHDGIRLPSGIYYVGRQIESAGAEERIVAD